MLSKEGSRQWTHGKDPSSSQLSRGNIFREETKETEWLSRSLNLLDTPESHISTVSHNTYLHSSLPQFHSWVIEPKESCEVLWWGGCWKSQGSVRWHWGVSHECGSRRYWQIYDNIFKQVVLKEDLWSMYQCYCSLFSLLQQKKKMNEISVGRKGLL